jgi:hypothetical protein
MNALTQQPFLRRLAAVLGLAGTLSGALPGCASLDVKQQAVTQTQTAQTGPELAPFRTITGFSPALRCMDKLFIDYGVRDLSMLVEDVLDQTRKVNAGTRDMLITAVSDMTRRSRAVRVIAFGRDATNVITFLASAQRQGAYEVVPQFDIKGSVSQFDENVIRNQKDVGLGIQPFLNLGVSRDAASSILGLDLSVMSTDDMSILSGVTSRNSVVILKTGKGADVDAAYHKFGVSYSMSLSKSEGQSQALRGLVELAVIELMGKLTKTPYWSCLGADAETNAEIKLEMADWFYAMAASRVELIGYFQNQLRRRGFYDGPVDGEFNPAIDEAIANYRAALGLERKALLDEAFFTAYLKADHSKIPRPDKPAVAVLPARPATPVATPITPPTPPTLQLATSDRRTAFATGEPYSLTLQSSRDAYVYCYLLDEAGRLARFFPNRFARDAFVPGGRPLALPGKMRFQFAMNGKGARETATCFATPRDVSAELPTALMGTDFDPLPSATLAQLRSAFLNLAGPALAQETLHVQAR